MDHPILNRALSRIASQPVPVQAKGTKIRSANRQSATKWLLGIPLLFSRKLNVWDAQKGAHVYTSVSKSDWKKIKVAANDEASLANESERSLQVRKKLALEIIRKTGQAQGLTVLDRASPHQLCVIARQLARYGHIQEHRDAIFKDLREAQKQWQALSMDPQALKMVTDFVDLNQVVYAQPAFSMLEVSKVSKAGIKPDLKDKFPDKLRSFVADLISIDERDRDQEGSDPQRIERIKNVFNKHPTVALALTSREVKNQKAELAKACGVKETFIDLLIKIQEERNGLLWRIVKGNKDDPEIYESLTDQIDEAVALYRHNSLPEIGAQLCRHIPQKNGNFGKFLNEVFRDYFQNLPDNDARGVMASSLREAGVKDPAERHLVAALKGSGPYMLKILQLMGDSVDASTPEGAKLKEALGELKDQLLPISPDIQKAMLGDLIGNPKLGISKIVDVRPLGAASVGQTFLAKIDYQSGQSQSAVIKLLKPGVDQRAARERAWMETVAKKHPGIEETFAGIANQIDGELDLSREADNVDKAEVYRQAGVRTLTTVKNVSGMQATQEHMFMERAPGKTIKEHLKDITGSLADLDPEKINKPVSPESRVACEKALKSADDLAKGLHGLASVWMKEALFGSGFYHGDLHGGNMMIDLEAQNSPLTLIDFGNAGTLTRPERANILKLIMASENKYPEVFVDTLAELLGPQSQARLKDPEIRQKLVDQVSALCQDASLSGSKRMLEAFNAANTLDIAIPNVISNFARSQNMLDMTIKDLNKVIQRSSAVLEAMGNPPNNPPKPSSLSDTLKATIKSSKREILWLTSRDGWAMRHENASFGAGPVVAKPDDLGVLQDNPSLVAGPVVAKEVLAAMQCVQSGQRADAVKYLRQVDGALSPPRLAEFLVKDCLKGRPISTQVALMAEAAFDSQSPTYTDEVAEFVFSAAAVPHEQALTDPNFQAQNLSSLLDVALLWQARRPAESKDLAQKLADLVQKRLPGNASAQDLAQGLRSIDPQAAVALPRREYKPQPLADLFKKQVDARGYASVNLSSSDARMDALRPQVRQLIDLAQGAKPLQGSSFENGIVRRAENSNFTGSDLNHYFRAPNEKVDLQRCVISVGTSEMSFAGGNLAGSDLTFRINDVLGFNLKQVDFSGANLDNAQVRIDYASLDRSLPRELDDLLAFVSQAREHWKPQAKGELVKLDAQIVAEQKKLQSRIEWLIAPPASEKLRNVGPLFMIASIPDAYPDIKVNLMRDLLEFLNRHKAIDTVATALSEGLAKSPDIYRADPRIAELAGHLLP